ncbi:MAG: hypothetical protein LQ339_004279 [Xanthoria mediterranea]|nr:MAG: hypothetical protein LQ339_004279 [Xanthoria mediterranea]
MAADTAARPGEAQQDLHRPSATRFSPEEEAALLSESNADKSTANELFRSAQYSQAISVYDRALAAVPNYLEYEIAVLKSNIAACHLKLSDWNAAVEEATKSLEALDRLETPPASKSDDDDDDGVGVGGSDGAPFRTPGNNGNGLDKHLHHAAAAPNTDHDDGGVVELADDEENEAEALQKIEKDDRRKDDIKRIRTKALMRRARAKSEQGGWGNLQGALEDYQTLSPLSSSLAPSDAKIVNTALQSLPARVAAAKEKEMGEMMGKLKNLGNGFLKPFGLSTDSFKFEKDEKTGGYSIGMNG